MKKSILLPIFVVLAIAVSGCGGSSNKRSAPELADTFLWGDSIRAFYEPHLIEISEGRLAVWSPGWYDGMTAESLLEKVTGLLDADLYKFEVFHINTGLHDLYYEVSPAKYEEAMLAAVDHIRTKNPLAPIILATTTPIAEGCNDPNGAGRIIAYNNALNRIALSRTNLFIDDLNAAVIEQGLTYVDCLHFTTEASIALATEALLSIEIALSN